MELFLGGWSSVKTEEEEHIIPVDDYREHFEENCWCHPIIHEGVCYHNSMDQRELYECGDIKLH